MTKKENKKKRERYLEAVKLLLNDNFKACEVERHPTATLEFWISEYIAKYHRDSKKKIGVKTQKRVHRAVVEKLRKMYGPWVTVRIHEPKRWRWDTNLGQVYKTDRGRIYGTPAYDDLFITSHAIERWEQRAKQELWVYFNNAHTRRFHITPSALDRIIFLIESALQVGISYETPTYRYLNVNGGVFVIEILEGIMVVKTFLNYHMSMPSLSWYNLDDGKRLEDMTKIIDPPTGTEEDLFKLEEELPASFSYRYFKD